MINGALRSRRRVRVIVRLAAVVLVFNIAALLVIGHRIRASAYDVSDWDPQWRNVDQVAREGRLIGLTREGVVTMYGEPSETDHFRDWDMVYCLGPERGFMRIDNEWLVLRLQNRQVIEARIARD